MENKAWAKSPNGKCAQAQFMALTHNLVLLLERKIESEEGILAAILGETYSGIDFRKIIWNFRAILMDFFLVSRIRGSGWDWFRSELFGYQKILEKNLFFFFLPLDS